MDKVQEHIEKVREALLSATQDWHDNGNEIVSLIDPRCGIGGFLNEEDNHLAANAPSWLQQSLDIIEQQQAEFEQLRTAYIEMKGERDGLESVVRVLKDRLEQQQREIERLQVERDKAIGALQGYALMGFEGARSVLYELGVPHETT